MYEQRLCTKRVKETKQKAFRCIHDNDSKRIYQRYRMKWQKEKPDYACVFLTKNGDYYREFAEDALSYFNSTVTKLANELDKKSKLKESEE